MLPSPFVYSTESLSDEEVVAIEQETNQVDSTVQQNSESEADNRRQVLHYLKSLKLLKTARDFAGGSSSSFCVGL